MRLVFLFTFICHIECQQRTLSDELFSWGIPQGRVSKKMEEASGLISSTVNPGMLWTHNDSGNPAEIFLIDSTAKTKMTCTLKGIINRDWEDITIGPGPKKGKSYIYVGDIGDNLAQYKTKLIYRFEEPLYDGDTKEIKDIETLMIQLPDGVRDTEAMIIDPFTNNLFLVSKREDSVRLYQIDYPFAKGVVTAKKVAVLDLTQIVAANISHNGEEVLMKNYNLVYYWKRKPGQSLIDLLQQKPVKLPYDSEAQGESICFAHDEKGYYTLSESTESTQASLMYYKRN